MCVSMAKALLTSGYFFFICFTYFYVGKAYSRFTGEKRSACMAG